jgi:hypothetical protein
LVAIGGTGRWDLLSVLPCKSFAGTLGLLATPYCAAAAIASLGVGLNRHGSSPLSQEIFLLSFFAFVLKCCFSIAVRLGLPTPYCTAAAIAGLGVRLNCHESAPFFKSFCVSRLLVASPLESAIRPA